MENQFDVIVIGSGIGGMTAASLLSQFFSKKVLVIEKHWTFGGLTHEFKRGEASFATGVHYIGAMGEGEMSRQIFDAVTGKQVQMQKMVEAFDEVVFPELKYQFKGDFQLTINELAKIFPQEKKALQKFFKTIGNYNAYMQANFGFRSFMPPFFSIFKPLVRLFLGVNPHTTVQAYLDKHFQSPLLKAILATRWGDYGVPPQEASLLIHSLVVFTHYSKGGYYPVGGSEKIGMAVREVLKNKGAEVLLNTEVKEIIIENKKAVGVRTLDAHKQEKVFYASHVISDAGAEVTYNQLLPKDLFPEIQQAIQKNQAKVSFVSLYLTLKKNPQEMGFTGANVWLHSKDYIGHEVVSVKDKMFPTHATLFFPTMKGQQSSQHIVEILAPVYYEDFEEWEQQKWKERDESYQALKEEIGEKILALVDSYYPDFSQQIDFAEESTPLSVAKFTNRKLGSPYGVPQTATHHDQSWLSAHTPIANLFLAGQDAGSLGVVGSMMGGLGAASLSLGGKGFFQVMKTVKEYSATK
jgi:all-trans-retinol 13,14-reductase